MRSSAASWSDGDCKKAITLSGSGSSRMVSVYGLENDTLQVSDNVARISSLLL